MDALERLAKLLAQQHSLQSAAAASSGTAPPSGSLFATAGVAAAGASSQPLGQAASAGAQQKQLQLPQVQPEHQHVAGPAAQHQPPPDGGMGAASAADLQSALASLLKSHQHLLQPAGHASLGGPQLQQRAALDRAATPSLAQQGEGPPLNGSRGSSADTAPAAAAGGGGDEAAGRVRQVELAKAVSQLVVSALLQHPTCTHLKQLGAAISEALVKCVAPGGLRAPPQPQPQPPGLLASEQHHHALLAALLQQPPAVPAPAGAGSAGQLLQALEGAANGGGGGHDMLLAAALQGHLQQQGWQEPPAAQQPGQLFRPQPLRAPSRQQGAGADQAAAARWPQLAQSVQTGGGGQVRGQKGGRQIYRESSGLQGMCPHPATWRQGLALCLLSLACRLTGRPQARPGTLAFKCPAPRPWPLPCSSRIHRRPPASGSAPIAALTLRPCPERPLRPWQGRQMEGGWRGQLQAPSRAPRRRWCRCCRPQTHGRPRRRPRRRPPRPPRLRCARWLPASRPSRGRCPPRCAAACCSSRCSTRWRRWSAC